MVPWLVIAAAAEPTFYGALGGVAENQAHGIVDAGVETDHWALTLYTDTLDARAWHQGGRGLVEVGLTGCAFAGGMWLSPWTNGAPDLTRAQWVSYVGPDLWAQAFLGHGWYAEGMASGQRHLFQATRTSTVEVADRWWLHGQGTLGGWFADGQRQLRISGGVDHTRAADGGVLTSPFAQLTASFAPSLDDRSVAPRFSFVGRVAEDADAVVATRVGGMTPYHVPLAGAAWAELWVEDVLATRGTLAVKVLDGEDRFVLHGAVDAVAWTGTGDPLAPLRDGVAVGLESGLTWTRDAVFLETKVGYAPGLQRQPGIWPVPVYLLAGIDGAPLR